MPGYTTDAGHVRATSTSGASSSTVGEETGAADPTVMAVPGLIGGLVPLRRSPKEDVLGGTDVPDPVATELRRRRGGGEPLPDQLAGPIGEHLGTDLSGVRVHADHGAGELARSVDAAAFTHGNDIYFAPGAYQPGSPGGQRMLAHELSHVAQQRSGADSRGAGSLTVGKADDPAEAAADQSADRAMAALRRSPATGARPIHDHAADSGDLDEMVGLEIRRWKWPWESKSKDKGSKDKGSKSKGPASKGSDVKVSGTATLPLTAPSIIEEVKDTTPTTSVGDTKDTVPTAPPQPTVGEDTKDSTPSSTPPSYPPPPVPTTVGEDTKDTAPTSTVTDVKTGTGPETTTATESKDTAPPTVEAPVVTYPRAFTIGTEQIQVGSAEEEVEADKILSDLKTLHGLDLSSATTIKAIKKDYNDVPKRVTNKLAASVWSMKELRALQEAAMYYAPILGTKRETSTLKGVVQGVTTVGKAKNGIDQGGKKGKLDTTTVGEYFSASKNLSLFDAGTEYEDKDYVREGKDKTDVQTSLSATAVHEMAHALVEPLELNNWVGKFDYWADEDTKSGKKGAEGPPSTYGKESAAEDLCESVAMYFINRAQLKKACPGRDAFVDKVVKAWKPPEVEKVIDTAVKAPESETPPPPSEGKG